MGVKNKEELRRLFPYFTEQIFEEGRQAGLAEARTGKSPDSSLLRNCGEEGISPEGAGGGEVFADAMVQGAKIWIERN